MGEHSANHACQIADNRKSRHSFDCEAELALRRQSQGRPSKSWPDNADYVCSTCSAQVEMSPLCQVEMSDKDGLDFDERTRCEAD